MGKTVSHRIDIYGNTLHLATDKRSVATLRRRFDGAFTSDAITDGIGSTTPVRHGRTGETHIVLWLDLARIGEQSNPERELIDTIAHEASHAADEIATRGLDNEARAYLVGWIAGWMWEQVKG